MKNSIKVIGLCLLLSLSGCGTLLSKNKGVTGKTIAAEERARAGIEQVNESIVENDKQKLSTIGFFATGTDYALSKIPSPDQEVGVARELNARILSLAENPNLEQVKKVHEMVDNLVSILQQQKEKGLKELAKSDEFINIIQVEKKALEQAKENEIRRYMDVAQAAAGKADQYAATLGSMDSLWGLGAIFYGVKKFITKAFLFLTIFAFIYLVLRVLATMHPAGAAAFQIFDMVASVFMNIIKALAPGAAKMAKLVPEATSSLYRQTLGQMVGKIEELRDKDVDAMVAGEPLKKYTLAEILGEFSKTMNTRNKEVITDVKSDIKKID